MKIAAQLKETNIAEYLLYMWQVEDLIRVVDIEKLAAQYPPEDQKEAKEWYGNLAEMMRTEGVMKQGHLQINKNVIQNLVELHGLLLASTKYPFYNAAYFKALPMIVELRQMGKQDIPEIETCFEFIYGVFLLRVQRKEMTDETSKAIEAIRNFLSLLANYYEKDKKGEIDI